MSNLFENLDLIAQEEGKERKRAAVLANTRARNSFSKFLASTTTAEFKAKLELISDDLSAIIKKACEEQGYSNIPEIEAAVLANLKAAADVQDGDSYWQETVDLPAAGPEGRSDEASGGKFDEQAHGDYKGWQTPSLEVPSNEHPAEMQNIADGPDLWSNLDPENLGLVDRVDPESPIGEEQVGEATSVYPAGNQAQPVSSTKKSVIDFSENQLAPGANAVHPHNLAVPEGAPAEAEQRLVTELGMTPQEAKARINEFLSERWNELTSVPNDSHLDNEDLRGMHQQGEEDPETDAPPAEDAERLSHDVQGTPKGKANQNAGGGSSKWRVV